MKKLVSFIVLMWIALGISAGESGKLEKKFRNIQQKHAEIAQRTAVVFGHSVSLLSGKQLKNAVVSDKLDSIVTQVFTEENEWRKDSKSEFFYNEQLQTTGWIEKEWNGTSGLWDPSFKMDFEYGNNGRITTVFTYSKDSVTHELVVNSRSNYFYNQDGLPDSVLIYHTEDKGANWLLFSKQIYFYNESKQLIKMETWALDDDAGTLVLSMQTDYTYTAFGKIQQMETKFIFGEVTFPSGKSEYFYDSSHRLTSVEEYSANFLTQSYEKSGKNTYQYNSNGDLLTDIYSKWDGSAWVEESKDDYEYGTKNFSDVAFPILTAAFLGDFRDTEYDFSKIILRTNGYEKSNENWKHTEISTYYYSGGSSSTNINEIAETGILVFPNPASKTVSFNWKDNSDELLLKMYQVTGALSFEQKVRKGREVSISHLVNGIYLYKLMRDNQIVYSGKLIKR